MLKQRVITAIILIPITLLLLFYLPSPAFCLLTAFIVLAAAWEWTTLMEINTRFLRFLYLVIVGVIISTMLFVPVQIFFIIFTFTFLWWLLVLGLIIFYPAGSSWWSKSIFWRGMMGIFALVPCWIAINYIRNQDDGVYALIFLFALIWGVDSAAYFVGKKWGKHKLAPRVSPGKSIEGLFGAIICSILITLLALWLCKVALPIWVWAIGLSVITVLFSIVGDLFESMLKRNASLKDSSQLLPGHGGLLDRIDSLIAAAPIFAFGALLLGVYLE